MMAPFLSTKNQKGPTLEVFSRFFLRDGLSPSKEASFPRLRSLRFLMAPQRGCLLCTAVHSFAGRLFLHPIFDAALLPPERISSISSQMVQILRQQATV